MCFVQRGSHNLLCFTDISVACLVGGLFGLASRDMLRPHRFGFDLAQRILNSSSMHKNLTQISDYFHGIWYPCKEAIAACKTQQHTPVTHCLLTSGRENRRREDEKTNENNTKEEKSRNKHKHNATRNMIRRDDKTRQNDETKRRDERKRQEESAVQYFVSLSSRRSG